MAALASRSRMLYRHLRLSETHRSLCGVAQDCIHNVMSRQHTVPPLQGATTQTPGLKGGDGRSRGGFDPGSQGTDHYGDGGGHNEGRRDGSSNANIDGNSPFGVDNDGGVEISSSPGKNLSDAKNFESPASQESVGTSHGSSLKVDPSTSINTAILADAPSSSSIPHLKDSSSSSSSSFPTTRISINTLGVATSSNAIPSSAATSTNFIAPQTNLSKRSNYGAIAGSSVGALVVVVLLVLAAWILYKRWNKNRPLPSDEFVNTSAASYPFAHAGFSYTISGEEKKQKNEMTDGIYHGTRTSAAGQAEFKPSFTVVIDPAQRVLSEEEKESQPGDYRDMNTTSQQSRLPASQPHVLYATPPPRIVVTCPAASGTPTVPRTPQGRRVPFGTGTFQFPRRPPESQGPGQGNPP